MHKKTNHTKRQQTSASSHKKLCLVAGGSGGHITPALILGKQSKQHILFFCTKKKLDQKILSHHDLPLTQISLKLTNLPGKKLWRYPIFFFYFLFSILKSFYFLKKHKPNKVISTGGLVALPVCLAGKLLSIPIELYEFNVIPGKATRFLSPLAQTISITFDASKKFFKTKYHDKCELKNYPLRFSPSDKTTPITRPPHFEPNRKTIFLLGGSQGSIELNNMLKKWIETCECADKIQIIHQTGSIDKTDWQKFYAQYKIPAITFSYTNSIKNFYLLADLIICRAGAGTLFELEFFQKPSLLIPLKNHASDHQTANAREMCKRYPRLFSISSNVNLITGQAFQVW